MIRQIVSGFLHGRRGKGLDLRWRDKGVYLHAWNGTRAELKDQERRR